jgi:CBS domain-containing protein
MVDYLEHALGVSAMGSPVMRVSSIVKAKGSFVATASPSSTVRDVLAGLAEHGVGALVVSADGHEISGIVSERDIVRELHARGDAVLDLPVTGIMTTDVRTCSPDDSIDVLMELMTEQRIRHVPVVVDGVLAGIVSIGDVVKNRIGELVHENSTLHEYLTSGR